MSGWEEDYSETEQALGHRALMECRICWTPYDPAMGDSFRRIDPGTPFSGLPDDWNCPNCAAPKENFGLRREELHRPASPTDSRIERLVRDFSEISRTTMSDAPLANPALRVEAVGFRTLGPRIVGVLIAPWFMNLIVMPGPGDDWSRLVPGEQEFIPMPSGSYEFLHNWRELSGGYKSCSLFSPMGEFASQTQAVAVAETVMKALFEPNETAMDNREPVDVRRTASPRKDVVAGAGAPVGLHSAVGAGPGEKA